MRVCFLFPIVFLSFFGYSQEVPKETAPKNQSHSYAKLDLSFPIRANEHAGEIDPYTGETEYWFLPDGISARFGYGIKPVKWLGIGANFGIDWKAHKCLVVAPIFGTLKICPIPAKDVLFFIEPGFGRALALGSNDLSGYFKKISVGLEDTDSGGFGLYLEVCQYGFSKVTDEKIGSLSIGLTYKLH